MLMRDIRSFSGIYIACVAVDFRKSIDGLAHMVKQELKMDPFGNYLFLFCNRSRNKIKALFWDKNGFFLGYKRLDGAGAKFVWPRNTEAARNISIAQLEQLLMGMSVDPPRGFGEITARDF
ncbi:MAG: IS66 family insertion sequence element accessory protein TnpB [Fibromonadaceae bacterium]|jgi:transposase|nr:IS66 family insertion sequence element accessory protein TnpB [Fibromonadaceae bacterium]